MQVSLCVFTVQCVRVPFAVEAQEAVSSINMATPSVQLKYVRPQWGKVRYMSLLFQDLVQLKMEVQRKCHGIKLWQTLLQAITVRQRLLCCCTIKTNIPAIASHTWLFQKWVIGFLLIHYQVIYTMFSQHQQPQEMWSALMPDSKYIYIYI